MHILMGQPLNPREDEKKGLVHETVSGKALDRAMEIARSCRRIRRIRSPTLNVSSATLRRRRWRKALRLNESLLEIMRQRVRTRAHAFL